MKGVKPLYYNIKDDKNFKCPICGGRLILEKTIYSHLSENGRATDFNNYAGDFTTKLVCSRCKNDMTNQLNVVYYDGYPIYSLINLEEKNNVAIIYNYKKEGFFMEE